jgi:hypothetical protein
MTGQRGAGRWSAKKLVNSICESSSIAIHGLTPRRAHMVRRYLASLSATNCWWVAYGARGMLSDMLDTYHPARPSANKGKEGK